MKGQSVLGSGVAGQSAQRREGDRRRGPFDRERLISRASVGAGGTIRFDHYADEGQAVDALAALHRRKTRRGYRDA